MKREEKRKRGKQDKHDAFVIQGELKARCDNPHALMVQSCVQTLLDSPVFTESCLENGFKVGDIQNIVCRYMSQLLSLVPTMLRLY